MKRILKLIWAACILSCVSSCTLTSMDDMNDLNGIPDLFSLLGDPNAANKGDKGDIRDGKNGLGYDYYVVSVRKRNDSLFVRLNEQYDLLVDNPSGIPAGAELGVCAIDFVSDGPVGSFYRSAKVKWIIPIDVQEMGVESSATVKKVSDPVSIKMGYYSMVYDGYLLLQYLVAAEGRVAHSFYLTQSAEDPTLFHFRHDGNGDRTSDQVLTGLVAFRLGKLPVAGKEGGTLVVSFKNLEGKEESVRFGYKSGK